MTIAILLVDDQDSFRSFLGKILADHGYEVIEAATLAEAHQVFTRQRIDIVLLDLGLPDGNGLGLLEYIRQSDPHLPVIIITGHGAIESAVSAMKLSAWDYITKPPDADALLLILQKAQESIALRQELEHLRRSARSHDQYIVGETPAMLRVRELIDRVAPTTASVLVTGESGTGKEVFAHTLHSASERADRAFVPLNCAAVPDHLMESELFGYEAGAFTGAHRQKKGLVEVADEGTLFLDEISSMKPDLQAKLLRFLEDHTFRRVGGTKDRKVDIRLIAASNRDLQEMIANDTFRADLYYRLNVVPVHLPPLRARRADIRLFAAHFLDHYTKEMGKNIQTISPHALDVLTAYAWPGNIRELRNTIERAVLFCDGATLEVAHLPLEIAQVAFEANA